MLGTNQIVCAARRVRCLTVVELRVRLRIYFDFIEIFHRMQRVSRSSWNISLFTIRITSIEQEGEKKKETSELLPCERELCRLISIG